jgi:hypothetical protein
MEEIAGKFVKRTMWSELQLTVRMVNPCFDHDRADGIHHHNCIWVGLRNLLHEGILSRIKLGKVSASEFRLLRYARPAGCFGLQRYLKTGYSNQELRLVQPKIPSTGEEPSPESAVIKTRATSLPDATVAAAARSVSLSEDVTVLPSWAARAVMASRG